MKQKQISIVLEMGIDKDEFEICKQVKAHIKASMPGVEFVKSFTKIIYKPNNGE